MESRLQAVKPEEGRGRAPFHTLGRKTQSPAEAGTPNLLDQIAASLTFYPTVLRSFAILSAVLGLAGPAGATDYFVGSNGNDHQAGTTPETAWRSLERASRIRLAPGDRLMFQGNESFAGTLRLDAADSGNASQPVVITSYGPGRATVKAGRLSGLIARNTGGVVVSNMVFEGAGPESNQADGLLFQNDLSGGHFLEFVRIVNVDASGFGGSGLSVAGGKGGLGFRDFAVAASTFHDNKRAGILFWGQRIGQHENIRIDRCRAYDNPGDPASPRNSGSGIVLGNVSGATIEHCAAWRNGASCRATEGPVGIWTYDSRRVVIQNNESHHNQSGGPADGGGFDLDQNVTDSVMQGNYSHDNDGAGFLLAHAPAGGEFRGNVVRFNMSENDGRKNNYAGIDVWGRVTETQIYHNTVVAGVGRGGMPRALRIFNDGIPGQCVRDLLVANNLLVGGGGAPVIEVTAGQVVGAAQLRLIGNNYFSPGGALTLLWNGRVFSRLEDWRAATRQEVFNSAGVGSAVDPMLLSINSAVRPGGAVRAGGEIAGRIGAASSMRQTGLNLRQLFGIDPGSMDCYGTEIGSLTGWNIGADQSPRMSP